MWTREEERGEIIEAQWKKGEDAMVNVGRMARKLGEWSKHKFGDFAKEMRTYKDQMGKLMCEYPSRETIAQMWSLDQRMDELELREELYWKQRSRQDWSKHGDKNTKFFHAKAKQRVKRNNIKRLKDADGEIYEKEEDIAEILVRHFQTLFQANDYIKMNPVLDKIQEKLSNSLKRMLGERFTREEILDALKHMHPTKAPGPDGMCALFYQKFWNTVGDDVTEKILDILNNNAHMDDLNKTYIALIPKKKECDTPVDFRPISLCNVMYKILSKVLANRLKRVLPTIIHESHSGFVPGRLISDNILVAYECFHYLRKKKKGKVGYMGLKLDMSKAYDRVEWEFLERLMIKLGFPTIFVRLLMNCVKSTSFSILLNGQPTRSFTPSQGLRQGDPLSPFLFIIRAEGLSSLLLDAEAKREIHGLKIGKKVDAISHLFFADDSLLFTRANEDEVDKVLEILSTYEAASGHKLNMEKFEVSFNRNIDQEKQHSLQMKLSFKAVEDHGKYLWLQTFVSGSKKKVFKHIQEKVMKKLKGWKEGFLSHAGREVLIKAIAQAIPTYAMQCFALPSNLLSEMESMFRSFFWGQKKDEKKLVWVAWQKMYAQKKEGGLGMRNLQAFNKALLAKQAWRIIKYPQSLMAKTLANKYFPHSTFMEVKISPLVSYTWRSILSAQELVSHGMCKVVGSGRTMAIWTDPWVPKLPHFRVFSRRNINDDGPKMVSDLIEDGAWKDEVLQQSFSPWEASAIKSIALPRTDCCDQWVWHYNKQGVFTVRSAYYLELERKKQKLASTSTDGS